MDQTPVSERARRRVTRRLIPYLLVLYLLAYLDRSNLSIAKLGMQRELNLTDEIIGYGVGVFFLGYFLLEIPGALLVERWSARKWIARIMISWGLVAALMGLTGLPVFGATPVSQQFYTLRFLLGAAEAGFFPGVIVYLSHWFRAEDRARAKALFLISQPISVIVGLPLSRWILENVRWGGLEGWRYVFILEGFPSVLMGLVTLFYLTDRPEQARWLPDDEKQWLTGELRREETARVAAGRVSIRAAFRQPEILLLTAVCFFIVTGNQALLYFLPSITDNMKSMSITARTAVTVLPYIFGLCGILLNGFSSNRTGERRWHTALPMFVCGAGLSLAILAGDRLALVIAFFCLAGFANQAYLPVFWTLPTAFLGKSAAAAAIGTINSIGNLGGFVGPSIFGYLRTATGRYETGLWFLAGCMFFAGALASRIRVPREPKPIQ
ncbi:MAG TPA: MFS transporter [Bryobacteraceae bacterium]|jgi:ACS family tartrate transporter-like MFS transporter|nr:MFS transporter [Bryobacteraceae bacterium]